VAVGGRNTNGHVVLYSFDGKEWYDASGDMDGPDYYAGVAFGTDASGNNLWVSVGNGPISTIMTSRDGKTWTDTLIYGDDYPLGGSSVAFGYDLLGYPIWVATGKQNTLWSSDGFTWNTSFGNPFNDYDGHCVAYNGSLWVAVGGTPDPIRYSPDGRTWFNASGESFTGTSGGASVAYKNNEWIAVGFDNGDDNNILRSEDGINWTSGPRIGRNGYGIASTQPPILSPPPPVSLSWVIATDDGLYCSPDGDLWSHGLGSRLNGPDQDPTKVAYDGSGIWVAINTQGQIARSPNGLQWTDASGSFGTDGTYYTYGIAHGMDANTNPLFVAVGKIKNGNTILYSSDGNVWATASGSFGSGVGSGDRYGSSVAFGTDASGYTLWVAVGSGSVSDILTSHNGKTWNNVSDQIDPLVGSDKLSGYAVAFGYDPLGSPLWVATGFSNTLWSSDGQTWNISYGSPFSLVGGGGYGVAYNGVLWVAVGSNNSNVHTIRYSPDGRTWYNASGTMFDVLGTSVTYDSSGWIAVGDDTSGNNILHSDDGINWTVRSEFDIPIYGISATSPLPPNSPTTFTFTDTSGNVYTTSDVSGWNTYTFVGLEDALTTGNIQVQAQVQFAAPPPSFLQSSRYAAFLASATNPQMIAYSANPTTDPALCTIIPIHSANYVANIALFFPVGKTVSIVLTDGVEYIILTEDIRGFLCRQLFMNSTKTLSGIKTRVPVGGNYSVGQYTLVNYGIYGGVVSGLPEEQPTTTTTTRPTTSTTTTTTTGPLPCFVKGTRILTPTGYKCVEEIESGDKVLTSDNRIVNANMYRFTVDNTSEDTAPYNIQAGSIGPGLPFNDLHVSGNHAFQDAKGVWQIPKCLATSNNNIQRHNLGEQVVYYHVECPNYMNDHVLAEGITAESFNHSRQPILWMKTKSGYVRRGPNDQSIIIQQKTEVKRCDEWEFTPPTIVKVAKVGKPLQGQFWKRK
jgi:hypothetical protein